MELHTDNPVVAAMAVAWTMTCEMAADRADQQEMLPLYLENLRGILGEIGMAGHLHPGEPLNDLEDGDIDDGFDDGFDDDFDDGL